MGIVKPSSLAATLDAVNEAFFFDRPPAKREGTQAALWIASRQGLPGSYANMFAPTAKDFRDGMRLFTGEGFKTRAGTGCKLGNEAARALLVLDVSSPAAKAALVAANGSLEKRLAGDRTRDDFGTYCCGSCSVSVWRNLSAGGLSKAEARLAAGVKALRARRDGKGGWRAFPFWYTVLALSGIEAPGTAAELRYAAQVLEKSLARKPGRDKYARRRRALAERVLAAV